MRLRVLDHQACAFLLDSLTIPAAASNLGSAAENGHSGFNKQDKDKSWNVSAWGSIISVHDEMWFFPSQIKFS